MKLYIKLIFWAIVVIIVGIMGAYFYTSMEQEEKTYQLDIFSLIPENTKSILQINNLDSFSQQIDENIFDDFSNEKRFDWINFLSRFILPLKNEKKSFPGWGKGRIVVSFHDKGEIYYTKVRTNEISVWKDMLETVIFPPFPPVVQKYNGEKILHYSLADNRFFSCIFKEGIFIGSFNSKLIENIIINWNSGVSVKNDPNFTQISETAGKKTLATLFYYVEKKDVFLKDKASPALNIEGWTSSDISFSPDKIWFSGYYLPNDETHDFSASLETLKPISLFQTKLFPSATVLTKSRVFDLNAIQSKISPKDDDPGTQKIISSLKKLFFKHIENEHHIVYLKDSINNDLLKIYCLKVNEKKVFERGLYNYPNLFYKERFFIVEDPDLLSLIFGDEFFPESVQYYFSFFDDYMVISRSEEELDIYLTGVLSKKTSGLVDKSDFLCHISISGDFRAIRQYRKNSDLQFCGKAAEYPDFFLNRKIESYFTKEDKLVFYHIIFK